MTSWIRSQRVAREASGNDRRPIYRLYAVGTLNASTSPLPRCRFPQSGRVEYINLCVSKAYCQHIYPLFSTACHGCDNRVRILVDSTMLILIALSVTQCYGRHRLRQINGACPPQTHSSCSGPNDAFLQFINLISGSHLAVGEGLLSCTPTVQFANSFSLAGRNVTLIDTPGFDDSIKTDTEILRLISSFLADR